MDDVADEEETETFIVVHLEGAGKDDHGHNVTNRGGMGSWNVSRTNGPLGPPCVLPRPMGQEEVCYQSCKCKSMKMLAHFERKGTEIKLSIVLNISYNCQ